MSQSYLPTLGEVTDQKSTKFCDMLERERNLQAHVKNLKGSLH